MGKNHSPCDTTWYWIGGSCSGIRETLNEPSEGYEKKIGATLIIVVTHPYCDSWTKVYRQEFSMALRKYCTTTLFLYRAHRGVILLKAPRMVRSACEAIKNSQQCLPV
jgi:hypothetical protein